MNERIAQLIEYLGLNPTSFEKQIGVKRGRIATALSKNTTFAADVISKICAKYTGISAYWLLLGEGEMLRKEGEIVNLEDTNVAKQGAGQVVSLEKYTKKVEELNDAKDTIIAQKDAIISLKDDLSDAQGCVKDLTHELALLKRDAAPSPLTATGTNP